MNSFDDRKKGFEGKFAHDEETLFKINAKRNKFLGEWIADKLNKTDKDKEDYILEVIKSDMTEPGDEDVFKKVKNEKPMSTKEAFHRSQLALLKMRNAKLEKK